MIVSLVSRALRDDPPTTAARSTPVLTDPGRRLPYDDRWEVPGGLVLDGSCDVGLWHAGGPFEFALGIVNQLRNQAIPWDAFRRAIRPAAKSDRYRVMAPWSAGYTLNTLSPWLVAANSISTA